MVRIELDVLPLVIDAHEHIQPAALEGTGKFLADDVFEVLIFARNFDVNIEISMVHAFDLDQHGQAGPFGASRSETGHAVDHELTSSNCKL